MTLSCIITIHIFCNKIRNTVLQVMTDINFSAFVFASIPYGNLQFFINEGVNILIVEPSIFVMLLIYVCCLSC
jgi:hypothetical protein